MIVCYDLVVLENQMNKLKSDCFRPTENSPWTTAAWLRMKNLMR